jgi:methyl-accepting chemotaxis protein
MTALKRELRIGIGILVATQMVLAFTAIGLLSRMAPAIDRILQENVLSIEAAEEMLVVLALSREGVGHRDLDGQFFGALERARDNITEREEREILDRVEDGYRRFEEGSTSALAPTIQAVQRLVRTNREAMRRTRDQASRLSEAGAWAAVLAAIFGFAAGIIVVVRIQRRVVEPMDEIYAVTKSCSEGDSFRRCQLRDAPGEVREIMATLNDLLDHRFAADVSSREK